MSDQLRKECREHLSAGLLVLFAIMAVVAFAWTACIVACVLAVGGTWSQSMGVGVLAIFPTWLCAARIGKSAGIALVETVVEAFEKRKGSS